MQSWRRFPASREPHLSTQVRFTIMSISAIVHAGSVKKRHPEPYFESRNLKLILSGGFIGGATTREAVMLMVDESLKQAA